MKLKRLILATAACILAGLLTGCGIKTVDELYRLPKRSEEYHQLQNAIDEAMVGLEYCAPIQGENQQTIQLADLTGDGQAEAVLFAKGSDENPLKVFIFSKTEGLYRRIAELEFPGTAFEQVEYGDVNGKPGQELVIGRQMGNEVLHALSVYSVPEGNLETILTAGYTRFLTLDLDGDRLQEVFILRPGTEAGNGVAELYHWQGSSMERAAEAPMSVPVDNMRRVTSGGMCQGIQAVFVASDFNEDTIVTDVFGVVKGRFSNVSLSNESGTSVKTVRSYYVFGDDIDGDGLVELPSLLDRDPQPDGTPQDFIRWYNLDQNGQEIQKAFTYHNYSERWYLNLDPRWMDGIGVSRGNQRGMSLGYVFSLRGQELFTVYAYTGSSRAQEASENGGFVLQETDEVTYGAVLGPEAAGQGLTEADVTASFHFIQDDWKTGET